MTQDFSADGLATFGPLSKPVLQSLYHAVTGKTENLSDEIRGNVIIRYEDFKRLYGMLMDQLDVHTKVIEPTVTVDVKHANHRRVSYSSWERFTSLSVNNYEMTSRITLKIECVIEIPKTSGPQRCIVNVNLDSSLPVISSDQRTLADIDPFGFFLFMRREWPVVQISIDFVDFLLAKALSAVVQEWFQTLEKTPTKRFNDMLLKNQRLLHSMSGQIGRIGMAAFLGAYVWFSHGRFGTLAQATLAAAIGLLIWAICITCETSVVAGLFKRVASNVLPAVILLNEADGRAFDKVVSEMNSAAKTLMGFLGTQVTGIALSVVASYIYAFLISASH